MAVSQIGSTKTWWKEAVVYQIYPSAFKNSNGDGFGDLPGIISKIPYLKQLGIDVIWLSPIFESPLKDMGYGISDYKAIDSRYGSVADVEKLIRVLKQFDMKLMLDLVVNHTSDQHAWFKESRRSTTSPMRDWYIWRPAKYNADGTRSPPNNWRSMFFGGSAWEWDEDTEEYYLHCFCKEQPDLNWDNPKVREEVRDMLRFWLDKGVGGFRMDVINMLSKDPAFPDAPIKEPYEVTQPAITLMANGPHIYDYIHEINRLLEDYGAMTVGEVPAVYSPKEMLPYVHPDRQEIQMAFEYALVTLDYTSGARHIAKTWTLSDVRRVIGEWQTEMYKLGGWNAVYLENHDQPRSVSRWTDDSPEYRDLGAKMLALMQTTLGGTMYVYQGQELGMINIPRDWPLDDYKDVATIDTVANVLQGSAPNKEAVVREFLNRARDNSRTSMHWDASPNGGFSTGTPWMRVLPDYPTCNVEIESKDDNSVLSFWKRCLRQRVINPVLIYGDYEDLSRGHPQVFAYRRAVKHGEAAKRVVVVLNFSRNPVSVRLADYGITDRTELLSSTTENATEDFGPYEGRLYRVE